MPIVRQGRTSVIRAGLLVITLTCVVLVAGLPAAKNALNFALIGLVAVTVASFLLSLRPFQAPVELAMLAIEFLAVGAIGCVLVEGSIEETDARILFISGYLVSTLVAIVGARFGAALLGILAGVMVLGLGFAFTLGQGDVPSPLLVSVQVILIIAFTFHTTSIAGFARRQARQREMAQQVDREIKVREAAAAELVSFTQALADAGTLDEIAEAVLRHLRCHTGVHARAVVLEFEGEEAALWEEEGRIEGDQLEHRRVRLQESLARAGSNSIVRRLKTLATGIHPAPSTLEFRTQVDIPVRVGGRIAGVLFIGDPQSGALPAERIGVLADVARRTSEAIRRLELRRDSEYRRMALLLRQMREGVVLLGGDGQVQLANPAARKVLAACRAEHPDGEASPRIGDLTLEELSHTPPGVSRRFRATITENENEQPLQLACTAISVVDRNRRIGTLVTLADVTEEELARGRIVQAERTTLVGQTLAGVAHELNNPLAALIGYADLLKGLEVPEDLEKPVSQMREQALRATRIVRNLLNFARRRNPERVPVSVDELVGGTVELFAYEARMAGVEVQADIAESLPRVLGDKHSLQQVLVNLVQNALHALAKWGGDRKLSIGASETQDGVMISVSDSGPGVPDDMRTKIFESFFTTKGPNKGTGLGLALSRAIAREHGGDLLLAPDTGSGATFSLRLPRSEQGRAAIDKSVMGAPAYAAPQAVLVVDDESSVRETLVAQLGHFGSRVDSAANVIEAQRLLSENEYDALIFDIRMPGGTGLELHDWLREGKPRLAHRVVFMTGDFVNDDLTEQARDTGQQLLEKPFTMDEMRAALSSIDGTNGDLETALAG